MDSALPADAAPGGYRPEIVWEGLGLVDQAVIPHWRSDHFESARIEEVVRWCEEHRVPHRKLRDGEVIVVRSETSS